MKIQKSVRKAIDEIERKDFESAMLHVCNAIDGTAKKIYPEDGSNLRFTKFIRSHYDLFGDFIGLYYLNWDETRWPVHVERPKASGGTPDFADMIYGIHRCSHGHGNELPDGFEFIEDTAFETSFNIQNGAIGLSHKVIWALIALVVFDPINAGLRDSEVDGYYLLYKSQVYIINEWWGRIADLPPLPPKTSTGVLDFSQLQ